MDFINFTIPDQIEYALRILLAAILGAVIGYERKNRLKEAGVRTHMIVCLGSALMMVISKYGFEDVIAAGRSVDAARIAAQVVTGIGFLGAGMIFIRKQIVTGLTTAAGIWAVAGIGMAVGAGMYLVGIIAAIMVVIAQVVLYTHSDFFHIPAAEAIEIRVLQSPDVLQKVREVFASRNIDIMSVKFEKTYQGVMLIDLMVKLPSDFKVDELMTMFSDLDYVISVEF